MKYSILLILILACSAFGQTEATTKDGKKVILNDDKTWNYVVEKKNVEEKLDYSFSENIARFTKENLKEISKSEFETESQFAERLAAFYKKHGEFALKVAPSTFNYDPETENFNISFSGFSADVSFVRRLSTYYFDNVITFDYFVGRPAAPSIKNIIEFIVYGYPVGLNFTGKPEFVATRIEIRSKDTGAVYHTEKIKNFLFPLPETPKFQEQKFSKSELDTIKSTPGTEVRVKGYTRKDGTYVAPHTRSAPKRKH